MSKTSDRIDRVVVDLHAVESEFKYGTVAKLERNVEYLERDRDRLQQQVLSLLAHVGLDGYTLQPTGDDK